MTEFPELQEALVGAARRRYGRAPRAWRLARPVLVVAVSAAVLAAIVVLAATPAPDEHVATPAVTPASTADEYGVFRRPATDKDTLPDVEGVRTNFMLRRDRPDFDPTRARLVAENGDWRAYLALEPVDGRPSLCTIVYFQERARRGGCGVLDGSPLRNYSFGPANGLQGAVVVSVADGIDEIVVRFDNDSVLHLPVRDNVVFAVMSPWPGNVTAIEWNDAGGHHEEIVAGHDAGRPNNVPTPTPTPASTATATPTPTPVSTATPTPTPEITPTPTPTPEIRATPTPTP